MFWLQLEEVGYDTHTINQKICVTSTDLNLNFGSKWASIWYKKLSLIQKKQSIISKIVVESISWLQITVERAKKGGDRIHLL